MKIVLMKELMKLVDSIDVKCLNSKELKVKLPDGSEVVLSIQYKAKNVKLKLVKSG